MDCVRVSAFMHYLRHLNLSAFHTSQIMTKEFGLVLVIPVGATLVGSIWLFRDHAEVC